LDRQSPVPTLLAILLCDQIVQDPATGKHSLLGTFSRVSAPDFPCVHPRLQVFVSLTDGHGAATGVLRLVRRGAEPQAPIMETRGGIEFPEPSAVVGLFFNVVNLSLPAPGRYSFDFYCNGALLGSCPFDAAQVAP
jgi:hypothetical protein